MVKVHPLGGGAGPESYKNNIDKIGNVEVYEGTRGHRRSLSPCNPTNNANDHIS